MELITAQSVTSIAGEQKKRGRPRGTNVERWAKARGFNPLQAAEVLKRVNEDVQWRRIFASSDERVLLQAMMFLVAMRDGRPAQQINVTSQSLQVSADSIEKARAIVRELRGEHSPSMATGQGEDNDTRAIRELESDERASGSGKG